MTNKFFERHVFFCTNQRPDGHPKGCCASKNSTVLRAYMKKKTKENVIAVHVRKKENNITNLKIKSLLLNIYLTNHSI